VGIVVLKPLAQALADGDAIAAVIRGSALGNDGSDKMSYWATNPQGQSAVMQQAFRQAGVDPESLGFVEAHGTATHLGDMIETYALRRAFATERRGLVRRARSRPTSAISMRPLGSAGLIKTVLTLQHRTLYPTLHLHAVPTRGSTLPTGLSMSTPRCVPGKQLPRTGGGQFVGVGAPTRFVVLEEAPAAAEVTGCCGTSAASF
jgi:acyl transferase domain-containing protein